MDVNKEGLSHVLVELPYAIRKRETVSGLLSLWRAQTSWTARLQHARGECSRALVGQCSTSACLD